MAEDQGVPVEQLLRNSEAISKIKIDDYVSDSVGKHTLQDILQELEKPNRDPRAEFRYAKFDDRIQTIQDLVTGSWMEGVVTNVTQFGAFVDIGVHKDGLIYISEFREKIIKNEMDELKGRMLSAFASNGGGGFRWRRKRILSRCAPQMQRSSTEVASTPSARQSGRSRRAPPRRYKNAAHSDNCRSQGKTQG